MSPSRTSNPLPVLWRVVARVLLAVASVGLVLLAAEGVARIVWKNQGARRASGD